MKIEEIKEGQCYMNNNWPNYFRVVEMIVESPGRPGGYVVSWSTDTFNVINHGSSKLGRSHGKCGILTFAKWANKVLSI